MTSITTRAGKGSPLTHNEVDANFTNLNNDKLDTAGIALGSAASPTLKFTGDPNTGIYSPSADQLAVSTGGTGRLFVDASGNIGIGTGPINIAGFKRIDIGEAGVSGGLLTLRSSGGAQEANMSCSAAGLAFTTNSYATPFDARASEIIFGTGSSGTERLRIDSSGNVGIGTSSPSEKLDVYAGSLSVGSEYVSTLNTDYKMRLRSVGAAINSNYLVEIGASGSGPQPADSDLTLATRTWNGSAYVTTEKARLTATGRLGIGTSSPSEKLDVYAGSLSVGSEYVSTLNTDYKMRLRSVGAATNNNYLVEIGASGSGPQPADSDLTLATRTWNGSAYVTTEKARLTATGRLGIGVTSPSSLLHLADAGDITVGTTTGTKIGTATTQKIGFYNATPVVQPTAVADATDAATVITQLNELLTRMRNLGLIAT